MIIVDIVAVDFLKIILNRVDSETFDNKDHVNLWSFPS